MLEYCFIYYIYSYFGIVFVNDIIVMVIKRYIYGKKESLRMF